MRLLVWNVNSLAPTVRNIVLRHGSLEQFFAAHDHPDLVCFQEVKLPDSKLTSDLVVVPGYQSYWATSKGRTGYSGVTTYARTQWAALDAQADCLSCGELDQEGRALRTDHGAFVCYNVYVPNGGERPARPRLQHKLQFLRRLKDAMDADVAAGRAVIAAGDFNVAAGPADVHAAINYQGLYAPDEAAAMASLLQGYVDAWRHVNPEAEGVYTVWEERTSARAFNVGCRIDYVLCSRALLPSLTTCQVLLDLPPKWSDHAPVLADFGDLQPASSSAGQGASGRVACCAMWQQLLKRFQDPAQRSIAGMFGRQAPAGARPLAAAAAAEAEPQPGAAAERAGAGGAAQPNGQQQQQHPRSTPSLLGKAPPRPTAQQGADDAPPSKLQRRAAAPEDPVPAASGLQQQQQHEQQQAEQQERDQQQQQQQQQQQRDDHRRNTRPAPGSGVSVPGQRTPGAQRAAGRGAGARKGAQAPVVGQQTLRAFFSPAARKGEPQ